MIAGFADSCAILRKALTDRKGEGMFKLSTLAQKYWGISPSGKFHEAMYDVEVVEKLVLKKILKETLFKKKLNYFTLLYYVNLWSLYEKLHLFE